MLQCFLALCHGLRGPNCCRWLHRVDRKPAKTRIALSDAPAGVLVFELPDNDPFLNLAFENWMYENLNLEDHDVLAFWRNSPCVVIGRHQNPWLECDTKALAEYHVKVARRYSGGGMVYHDLGNLNITFLTRRLRYHRRRNLESIVVALSRGWDLSVDISLRDDLLVDGLHKISGSAAKLGKHASYHHCTLLCDANLDMLHKIVAPKPLATISKSIQSVSSPVINLRELEPSITIDELVLGITKAYCQSQRATQLSASKLFERYYPEIEKCRQELQSWDWVYGRTGQFTVTRSLLLSHKTKVTITLKITSGIVTSLTVAPNIFSDQVLLRESLIGSRFSACDICSALEKCLQMSVSHLHDRTRKHLEQVHACILDMM